MGHLMPFGVREMSEGLETLATADSSASSGQVLEIGATVDNV